jgi:hypothetical protein
VPVVEHMPFDAAGSYEVVSTPVEYAEEIIPLENAAQPFMPIGMISTVR